MEVTRDPRDDYDGGWEEGGEDGEGIELEALSDPKPHDPARVRRVRHELDWNPRLEKTPIESADEWRVGEDDPFL